ncbi:MAG: DUF6114 domain-containing protein [Gordonia sp. (in: high G+C Gram-positive bacteria)]|uniref:DUF6114 domain-containing protein n=1 Tax=Gordonia sp. (in: high G+C Gram-positive bacteria) TaxID=84139 RepID=UPI0039E46E74
MTRRLHRFREWAHRRPFAGAVCLLISALFLALPAINGARIGDLVLTVSTISGVSTVVLCVLMALCGVAALLWLHTRVAAGLGAMVVALVAFPASNFGGYLVGTVFGILGAALVLAWRPLPDTAPIGRDDESSRHSGRSETSPVVPD